MTLPDACGTAPVASPCINVCNMDPHSGYCRGCLRTLDEIATWGRASDTDKRAILTRLAGRRSQVAPTSGMDAA